MGKEPPPKRGNFMGGRKDVFPPSGRPPSSNGDSSQGNDTELPDGFETWSRERQKQWWAWKKSQGS